MEKYMIEFEKEHDFDGNGRKWHCYGMAIVGQNKNEVLNEFLYCFYASNVRNIEIERID